MNFTPAKPIEPGCRALVLPGGSTCSKSEHLTGQIVQAEYMASPEEVAFHGLSPDMWVTLFEGDYYAVRTSFLMRIDPDTQAETETELEKNV